MNQIEELKRHINIVKQMLDAPEPGLATWHIMLREEMRQIINIWEDK